MRKIISCLFTLIILFIAIFPLSGGEVQAETLRNKKVVSVVYDDSSSMYGSNWGYANYAMQTFVAMLNSDDELYITYMSEPNNADRIETGDLISAVEGIRSHSLSKDTPYDAVNTAMNRLETVDDTNPNTQYWLVVFTDGNFNNPPETPVGYILDEFNSKKMANGSTPNIMYMTIGDSSDQFTPHPSDMDITVVRAQAGADVRDSLFDIASRATGRARVEDRNISFLDEHTISFSSNVPLLSISILVQNKKTGVASIKDKDQKEIPIKYEIPVAMPDSEISGADDTNDMFGVVSLAGDSQDNIAAGDYTISFSDAISKEDVLIMVEPALQLKIKLFKDGAEITDYDDITVNTEGLSAKAGIYEYGTDNEIMESQLSGDISKYMEFTIDDKTIDNADVLVLDQLNIAEGKNSVRAVMDIAGYFHLETSVDFSPQAIPIIDHIEAELFYDGSDREKHADGSFDAENVVYISQLKTNHTGICFTVYQDGSPITRSMAESMENEFREGLQVDFSNYDVEIQDDGRYLVYPTAKPWFVPVEVYQLQHQGEQTVSVKMNEAYAEGVLEFKMFRDIKDVILHYLWVALIAYVIWWILFKKHFPKGTLSFARGNVSSTNRRNVRYIDSDQVDIGWFGCFRSTNIISILLNLILLASPCTSRTSLGGYTFSGQWSLVKKRYGLIVRNVRGKQVSKDFSLPNEESRYASIEIDDKLFIKDGGIYSRFSIEN